MRSNLVVLPPPVGDGGFIRGDANASGIVDISDGIFTLDFLFLGAGDPTCMDSADSNDSGAVDISDGIHLLNYLFLGGAAPPPPDACGVDTTDDALDCGSFAPCDGP